MKWFKKTQTSPLGPNVADFAKIDSVYLSPYENSTCYAEVRMKNGGKFKLSDQYAKEILDDVQDKINAFMRKELSPILMIEG